MQSRNSISQWLFCAAVICAFTAQALEPMRLFSGPGTQIAPGGGRAEFDLDGDHELDLTVFAEPIICTTDIPPSACSGAILVRPEGEVEILAIRGEVKLLKPGNQVGPAPLGDAQWRTNTVMLTALVTHFGVASEWAGPLKEEGGYVGVRIKSIEGWRYGWIRARARSPMFANVSVEILDWAVEQRADTPIQVTAAPVAGIIVLQSPRAGNLRLQWEPEFNAGYQVQFKDALNDAEWENFDLTVIGSGPIALVDVPLIGDTRFYRVMRAE